MIKSAFEKKWQDKYSEAAKEGREDYQISLWAKEGLDAYIKYFFIYFKPYIQKDNSKTLMLDLGCGPGTFSRLLAQKGFLVHGIDYSPEVIEIAKKRTINEKVNYRVGDIYNLPFPDGFFDAIICLGVFQTVDNVKQALEEIESKLKPKGLLVFTALNHFSIFSFIARMFGRKKNFKPRRFSPYSFKNTLTKNGFFEDIKLKGMFFFPQNFSAFTQFIIKSKIYIFFNLFFPLFNFLSHSFYIETKKIEKNETI